MKRSYSIVVYEMKYRAVELFVRSEERFDASRSSETAASLHRRYPRGSSRWYCERGIDTGEWALAGSGPLAVGVALLVVHALNGEASSLYAQNSKLQTSMSCLFVGHVAEWMERRDGSRFVELAYLLFEAASCRGIEPVSDTQGKKAARPIVLTSSSVWQLSSGEESSH